MSRPNHSRGSRERSCANLAEKASNSGAPEKNVSVNRIEATDLARERFAKALEDAFPYNTKEEAAEVLGVCEKTIGNWLNCSSSAPIEAALTLAAYKNVFWFMQHMTLGMSRSQVWSIITGRK